MGRQPAGWIQLNSQGTAYRPCGDSYFVHFLGPLLGQKLLVRLSRDYPEGVSKSFFPGVKQRWQIGSYPSAWSF